MTETFLFVRLGEAEMC